MGRLERGWGWVEGIAAGKGMGKVGWGGKGRG